MSKMTLIEALKALNPESSTTTLRSWISEGRVTVDGAIVRRASEPITPESKIELGQRRKPVNETLPILYEDSHIVVIDKPAGLLSVKTAFETKKTAHALLKERFYPRKIYVIHRLDQDTSGVMLFALTEKAYHLLKDKFVRHDLDRVYLAVVEGAPSKEKGVWRSRLYEDKSYKVHITTDPRKGELAITHFKTLSTKKGKSLLEFKLETGKKNQIRVHCQEDGCPVFGDEKYGGTKAKRLYLHSHKLILKHPITGDKMTFTSPAPKGFE